MTESIRESSSTRAATLVLLFAAVSIVTRGLVLGSDVINVDEASYVVGAREWLRGAVPYTSFGDNKPPLIYAYFALAQLLIGHGIVGARVLTTVITVPLTALAISRFYDHDRRGVCGALAFLVFSASYDANDMLAINCELVMMLPLAWAAVLVRDPDGATRQRDQFLAGLLVSVASLVKYQAAFWAVPIVVAMTWTVAPGWRSLMRGVSAFGAGLVIPWAATAALFVALGGWDGFLYWNVTHNIGYVRNPVTAIEAFLRGTQKLAPFLAVTSPLWFAWVMGTRASTSTYQKVLLTGLVIASAATTLLGLRFFPHYFVVFYVPLAIGAAPWIARVVTHPMTVRGHCAVALSVVVLAGATTFNVRRYVTESPRIVTLSRDVGDRLRQDECFGDGSMFVWGSAPVFYYHADLPIASRFFFPEFPLVRYYAGNASATARRVAAPPGRGGNARHWRWLMNDLTSSRPTFILDTAPARVSRWQWFPMRDYPQLEQFVQREYEVVDSVEGVEIYRRRECRPFQRASR